MHIYVRYIIHVLWVHHFTHYFSNKPQRYLRKENVRARSCTARTYLFRLIYTQSGALYAPRPAHRSFADPSGKINDIL